MNVETEKSKKKSYVREIFKGYWAIPYSCSFTIKKIHNFEPENTSIDVLMDMNLVFKFSGL